jgi:RNA polymerase sigma-70 factor (ECF subfamily)
MGDQTAAGPESVDCAMHLTNTAPLTGPPLADREGRVPTRSSFVVRLKDWGDRSIWEGFFQRYGRLVRQAAVRSGLSADEAEDVVQETALSVARKMPDFVYERTRCSFEGWVRHVARLRIVDQLRRRTPAVVNLEEHGGEEGEGLLESIPDAAAAEQVDVAWREAWRLNLLQTAMERLQLKVSPDHFQIFHLIVVSGMSGPEVVRTLGVSLTKVYAVRHRLSRQLKQEVARLQETPGGLG